MAEYNGWKNYETWLTNLHYCNFDDLAEDVFNDLDIDQSDSESFGNIQEWIEDIKDDFVRNLASNIKHFMEEETETVLQDIKSGFFSDIINNALSEINYHEIASHYWDQCWDRVKHEILEKEVEDEV